MSYLLVLAILIHCALVRALWVAYRRVLRLRAELALTGQACDALVIQNRELSDQAEGYQAEAARLARRNTELRDQVDALGGSQPEPTLTEEWLAFMAELDVTFPEDNR